MKRKFHHGKYTFLQMKPSDRKMPVSSWSSPHLLNTDELIREEKLFFSILFVYKNYWLGTGLNNITEILFSSRFLTITHTHIQTKKKKGAVMYFVLTERGSLLTEISFFDSHSTISKTLYFIIFFPPDKICWSWQRVLFMNKTKFLHHKFTDNNAQIMFVWYLLWRQQCYQIKYWCLAFLW